MLPFHDIRCRKVWGLLPYSSWSECKSTFPKMCLAEVVNGLLQMFYYRLLNRTFQLAFIYEHTLSHRCIVYMDLSGFHRTKITGGSLHPYRKRTCNKQNSKLCAKSQFRFPSLNCDFGQDSILGLRVAPSFKCSSFQHFPQLPHPLQSWFLSGSHPCH